MTFCKHMMKNKGLAAITIAMLAMFLMIPVQALAQDYEYEEDMGEVYEEYEYEPGEGLHEKEWYDPSDWFESDDAIDYETDWYDYTYNYPYDYDYDYDFYGYDRGYYGDDMDYGWYTENEGLYEDWEYGWHYDYYTEDWFDEEPDFDDWY